MTTPKANNSSIIGSKDIEMIEMPDNEFKNLSLKLINDLTEDSNKHMSEVRKLIKDLNKKKINNSDEKFNKLGEKFSNKIDSDKKNQREILEMKSSVNQMKNSMESTNNRPDQAERRNIRN
jgi:rubrerythrin